MLIVICLWPYTRKQGMIRCNCDCWSIQKKDNKIKGRVINFKFFLNLSWFILILIYIRDKIKMLLRYKIISEC